ncbi:aminotransferase class V-fold PLP-dependent enzyme [Lentilitoribacter sp. Alg239-R112]|jgi:aspartate aminotransferase-like enzyme|uniref:aminotransferase class V-fold PLP-dependent enzyme n=1 Tax=Lentilitoribacter sp. Alg239-R112 TaxID=2305987 RepID=UPI0013A6F3C3|nr:aminotransferase class V-fold PLP-dependent enzyme [Lentilitoribacter sp. Alg239-R112]
MAGLLPHIDPDGHLEFSVVFTDRSLNSMSKKYQGVMNDISASMKSVYSADGVAIVPGGGTFAMEAVARQFTTGKKAMVVRNGWFSFRWTQIFETGDIPSNANVMMAEQSQENTQAQFSPYPIEDLVKEIKSAKPDVVFAPHVETSAGLILPDDYIKKVGEAVHSYGGLFVLDCIASGCIWVDMKECHVDVLISAPQKGWSASPAAGLVMLSEHAIAIMADTQSTSFACDLKKWFEIMNAYENGGHAYHATMPTDALLGFRDTINEVEAIGFAKAKEAQYELGKRVRELLKSKGYKSVAADGFGAPGVVVSFTTDPDIQNGKKFAAQGLQIAAGVPLRCNEPEDYSSFRIGLFGLDKLQNIDRTIGHLEAALDAI